MIMRMITSTRMTHTPVQAKKDGCDGDGGCGCKH